MEHDVPVSTPYLDRLLRFLFGDDCAAKAREPESSHADPLAWKQHFPRPRPIEELKKSGYLLGIVNSSHRIRKLLLLRMGRRLRDASHEDKIAFLVAHEALTRALEKALFTGRLSRGDGDTTPGQAIDRVDSIADDLLVWLDDWGIPNRAEACNGSREARSRYGAIRRNPGRL